MALGRIVSDPGVMVGKPVIRGTPDHRPAYRAGARRRPDPERIVELYPHITVDDGLAPKAFAAAGNRLGPPRK